MRGWQRPRARGESTQVDLDTGRWAREREWYLEDKNRRFHVRTAGGSLSAHDAQTDPGNGDKTWLFRIYNSNTNDLLPVPIAEFEMATLDQAGLPSKLRPAPRSMGPRCYSHETQTWAPALPLSSASHPESCYRGHSKLRAHTAPRVVLCSSD